jgi:hypothetical protein
VEASGRPVKVEGTSEPCVVRFATDRGKAYEVTVR